MSYVDNIAPVVQRVKAARIVEQGAGEYIFDVTIPAYAVISDIGVVAEALWDAATSAALVVGIVDDDVDTFFASTNLKATDLTLGQSISFTQSGGLAGASNTGTNTHWDDRYSTSERTLRFEVNSVGAGTAGRTICYVEYLVPTLESATFTAA